MSFDSEFARNQNVLTRWHQDHVNIAIHIPFSFPLIRARSGRWHLLPRAKIVGSWSGVGTSRNAINRCTALLALNDSNGDNEDAFGDAVSMTDRVSATHDPSLPRSVYGSHLSKCRLLSMNLFAPFCKLSDFWPGTYTAALVFNGKLGFKPSFDFFTHSDF